MNEKSTSPTDKTSARKVVIERSYRASVEELWALWTTKEGFESWWGPEGFRVEVHELQARTGGALHYDMIADAPEAVAAMKEMGSPISHKTRGKYAELKPNERLVLTHVIDFLPGVTPYESRIDVDFASASDRTRMFVTLYGMHDETFTGMQIQGFTSQLSKLDKRFEH